MRRLAGGLGRRSANAPQRRAGLARPHEVRAIDRAAAPAAGGAPPPCPAPPGRAPPLARWPRRCRLPRRPRSRGRSRAPGSGPARRRPRPATRSDAGGRSSHAETPPTSGRPGRPAWRSAGAPCGGDEHQLLVERRHATRDLPSRTAPTRTRPRLRNAPAGGAARRSCRSAVRSRRRGSAHGRPTAPAAASRPRRFPGTPAAARPAPTPLRNSCSAMSAICSSRSAWPSRVRPASVSARLRPWRRNRADAQPLLELLDPRGDVGRHAMQPGRGARHPALPRPRSERCAGRPGPSFSFGEVYVTKNSVFNEAAEGVQCGPMHTGKPFRPTTLRPSDWLVVGSGIVALAVAMGIGRFAFTPLMPLMMRDGTLSAAAGAEWAAANYGGYLVGALTASWFSSDPRRGLRLGPPRRRADDAGRGMDRRGDAGPGRCRAARRRRRLQCLGAGLREQLVPGRTGPAARPAAGRLDLHRGRPGHRAGRRARLARRAPAGQLAVAGAGADRRRGRDVRVAGFARSKHGARMRQRARASTAGDAKHGGTGICAWCCATAPSASATSCRPRSCLPWPGSWSPTRWCSDSHGRCSVWPPPCPSRPPRAGCRVGRAGASGRWRRALMALGTALPLVDAGPLGPGRLGRARGRNLHGRHHGRPAAGARAGSRQPDAAAGPDDRRLRRRTDRRPAPGSSHRPRQLGRLGCAGLGQRGGHGAAGAHGGVAVARRRILPLNAEATR